MNHYVITYLGGDKPSTPEEGKQHFAQYQAWLAELGDAVVKPMVPYKNIHTLQSDGSAISGSSVSITGHTVIQAESIEQAVTLAKGCPFLAINGTLEVAEVVEMPRACSH